MAQDQFSRFAMMPHLVEQVLSYLQPSEILFLASVSPTVANVVKAKSSKVNAVWSGWLRRRSKPGSLDRVALHETETTIRVVSEDTKMTALMDLLADRAPDAWFKYEPETAGVFVKDIIEAQQVARFLTDRSVSAEILNGPPSSGTIKRINSMAGAQLHVIILYRSGGNFDGLFYFSRVVSLAAIQSLDDLRGLLNLSAMRLNLLVTQISAVATREVIEYLVRKTTPQEDGTKATVIHQGSYKQ